MDSSTEAPKFAEQNKSRCLLRVSPRPPRLCVRHRPAPGRLPLVGFFICGRAGTPVAFLPDIDVVLSAPICPAARCRPDAGASAVARHPDPLPRHSQWPGMKYHSVRGAGRGNNVFLVRGRRLGGLAHVGGVGDFSFCGPTLAGGCDGQPVSNARRAPAVRISVATACFMLLVTDSAAMCPALPDFATD